MPTLTAPRTDVDEILDLLAPTTQSSHTCDYALCGKPVAALILRVVNDVAEARPVCAEHEEQPEFLGSYVKLRTLIVAGTWDTRRDYVFDVKPEHTGSLPAN
jgi:hypothetical protein